ncbi:hypothetical protein Leryth_021607 [Lithospermum erythrorhizon]|nr:hypothetical protein Leryth_021607 [Lithospermum erythrorhizon]
MQYKSGANISSDYSQPRYGNILEKKAPIQVIIPKARVENEEFLFSMRLKIGGNPAGSATILSGDGTATVSHFFRGSTRLYQFDLPNDAAKVLDASVFPSDDREEGAWAILTEKAGIWAIPERAILLGGMEPPERSLSRKGSSNERSSDERRNFSITSNIPPRRASSETWDSGDRPKAELTGIARRGAHDEESEALIGQLFHEFLLSGQVNAVYDKLKNSGAFERDGETNVFARTSKSIVDTLAKHWTTTRGAEIVSLSVLSTQLGEKQQKHQRFLQFLALSKCHEELSLRQRESLHTIMEHGEKLACMIQLRELQHLVSQNRASEAGSSYPSSESQVSGSLWDLIQLVGERARRNTVMLMDRENTEVFYSKVSDLQEVFYCLEKHLDCIINTEMPYPIQLRRACELSNACVTLLHTAMQYRNEHHMWYPSPEGLTPWSCQSVVRCGLWNMVSFMIQLSTETYRFDYETRLEFLSDLKALSEVLLEAYSGAITAKVDRGQEHKALLNEYWNRRDTLLDCLYQQVKGLADVQIQESKERSEGQYEEILETLSSGVLAIAKRHEGYQTLWNICSDLNDFELLRGLMHQGLGPKGGFSYFVFQQLHSTEQFSKLMRLGEEFPEELATFLKQHQDLFWLHEVFLHRFSSASESLHELALQRNESSSIVMEESHAHTEKKVSLVERKRFLKLSKIAALAGKDADYDAKVRRIDADLKILQLQEHILKVSPNIGENGNIEDHLLPPVDLIELCLKSQNRDLALLAFDVFAWTSRSFLKYNTDLLEECWRNAANQDNWEVLYERSTVEGWVEEETSCHLKDTVLFQASRRCYGPEAETFEGGFDEVLPLRQNNSGLSTMTDNSCSVEEILMQHRNFPDAGKLMLTAVVMGSMLDGSRMDDDGPSPME